MAIGQLRPAEASSLPAWPGLTARVASRESRSRPVSEVTILILATDPQVRNLYRLKFELDAYVVRHLTDGESAESCVVETRPDIVFADVREPSQWGLVETLRAVESAEPIPLLLLSDHRKDELARRGFVLRPNEYIVMSAER